ncbi:MAG: hypothetical protein RID91_05900 [Azospirillaceae bacterium]
MTDTADAAPEGTDTLDRARDALARCRSRVQDFEAGAARSNRALYEALETAYRLHADLAADGKARRAILRENKVRAARKGANPFTDVVKLAFGGADRMRVNKYASVLAHVDSACPAGEGVADWLDHPERGIENSVKAWRRMCRAAGARGARPTQAQALALAKGLIEQGAEVGLEQCEPLVRDRAAGDLVLLVARRRPDGSLAALHVADDPRGRDLDRVLGRLGRESAWTARFFAAELDKLAVRRAPWRRNEIDWLDRLITRDERAELERRLDEAEDRRRASTSDPSPFKRPSLPAFLRPSDASASAATAEGAEAVERDAASDLRAAVDSLRERLGGEEAFHRHVARLFDRFEVDDTRTWAELDPQLRYALGLVRGGNITQKVWDVLTPPVRARVLQDALPYYEQMRERWPEGGAPGEHTVIRDFLIEVAERRRAEGMPPDEAFSAGRRHLGAPETSEPARPRRMVVAPRETARSA